MKKIAEILPKQMPFGKQVYVQLRTPYDPGV